MTRSTHPTAVGLLLSAAVVFGVVATHERAPRTPYQTCIVAANTPGDAGFATEVCEPLTPGYVEPKVAR